MALCSLKRQVCLLKNLAPVLLVLALAGCATQRSATETAAVWCSSQLPRETPPLVNASHLARALCALSPSVEPAEANRAAETACAYAWELRETYRIVGTPSFHNLLINLRLKKRGLCYQWADDIAAKLEPLSLTTLVLDRAIARQGTWREHNALVLTAPGVSFKQGILLDGWRHSGRLYWGIVADDSYPWIRLKPPGPAKQKQTKLITDH